MNSDMSILTMASSVPNMNSASARTSSVLPTPVGPEEDERAIRAARITQASTRASDRLGDRDNRFVLTLDAFAQRFFHLEQAGGFLFGDLHDRDARPHRHHLGDVLGGDDRLVLALLGLPALLEVLELGAQLRFAVAILGRQLVLLGGDGRLFLVLNALERAHHFLERRRRRGALHAHAAGGLVDQVDRLVGHEAVGHIARAQLGGGLDRLVGDLEPVVLLVALLDALEDLDRVLDRRLLDQHGLEAALERGVALDVLAVLVERRGADRLQLAASQRRLEDVGGVNRAFGRAGADQRVQLVDEQHAVAAVLDLFDDLLEALLELTAVLGARDERADVEREQALAHQRLGHVAGGDALGQAFDDGRLADARLADEGRVVLGAPREDLDDALDLLEAADDRIELARPRRGGQVHAQLVDDGGLARLAVGGALAFLRVRGRLVQDVDDLRADLVQADAERFEHAGGDALALAHEAEQQVFGADVVVVEPSRLVDRQLDDFLGARGQANIAGHRSITAADDELDGAAHLVQLDAEIAQHLGRDALALADQAEQQVLSADVVVVEALRFLLR